MVHDREKCGKNVYMTEKNLKEDMRMVADHGMWRITSDRKLRSMYTDWDTVADTDIQKSWL
jgi:hypothetical protein